MVNGMENDPLPFFMRQNRTLTVITAIPHPSLPDSRKIEPWGFLLVYSIVQKFNWFHSLFGLVYSSFINGSWFLIILSL